MVLKGALRRRPQLLASVGPHEPQCFAQRPGCTHGVERSLAEKWAMFADRSETTPREVPPTSAIKLKVSEDPVLGDVRLRFTDVVKHALRRITPLCLWVVWGDPRVACLLLCRIPHHCRCEPARPIAPGLHRQHVVHTSQGLSREERNARARVHDFDVPEVCDRFPEGGRPPPLQRCFSGTDRWGDAPPAQLVRHT